MSTNHDAAALANPPTQGETIASAVIAAISEPDAPLSAWPGRLPGRWATNSWIAELTGFSTSEVAHVLRELAEAGALLCEEPWPSDLRGYQPTPALLEDTTLAHLPVTDAKPTRERILAALKQWADTHDGLAPSRADWSKGRDPERRWPRSDRVAEVFEAEAREAGVRYYAFERCDRCTCEDGANHWHRDDEQIFCDGCFDCRGQCPHGDVGEWRGPSGWQYALQLAGLAVRTGGDLHATAARTLGRNRQMVTGGVADIRPQVFEH